MCISLFINTLLTLIKRFENVSVMGLAVTFNLDVYRKL